MGNSMGNSIGLESHLDIEERERKKVRPHTFMPLLSLMLKHRWPLIMGVTMIVFGTFATLLEPRVLGYAIDEAIIPKRWDLLKSITSFFLFLTIVRTVSASQQGYFFELLGQRVTQDLRLMLFSHLQRMSVQVFDKNPAGRLMTRVTNDIAAVNEMFSAGFLSMLCNVLLVLGILVWLMILDLRLALIASSVFPVLILISIYFSKQLSISYRDTRSKLSALNSFLAENLSGMKIVCLFNRQKLHMKQFDRFNQWYADAQLSSTRVFALFQPAITLAAGISVACVIGFGGQEALRGSLKLGVLVAYFSYILSLFQPVREIADKWNIFLSGMASAERIFSILTWETELEENTALISSQGLPDLRGEIVFENVWFAYEDENWILRDFSLEIKAGERIGVVGHTGAGKSTLISLLMRFYEPQRGRILVDGKDLKHYDKRSLRSSIGIVQQEVFIFSGSFEENVTFWKNINLDKTKDFLNSIGFQYPQHTLLQERGSNFSMGERQSIAFARAFSKNPQIWILDEATANMDLVTERALQRCLDVASSNKTSLLIAHRLATIQSADRIIVLNKGSIIESGNHESLLHQNGLYARLYRYQSSVSLLGQ